MDIYMAGSTFKELNSWMQEKGYNKLFSQLNDRKEIANWVEYRKHHPETKSKLFVDSGAFSVHTLNTEEQIAKRGGKLLEVDVDEYIDYLNANTEQLTVYAQVDYIPGIYGKKRTQKELDESPEKSWENYKYMAPKLKEKHKLMPVFHQGEDWQWLDNMLNYVDPDGDHIDYIGIAPGKDLSVQERRMFLDRVFDHIVRSTNPNVKTHALGITSLWMLELYPFTSADSTSWIMTAVTGSIFTPNGTVTLSEQTQGKGINYHNMKDQNVKQHIKEYVESKGYTIEGLTSDYKQREMFNIMYLNEWADNYKWKERNLKLGQLF